jgi:sensor histidine kinase YesM
MILQPLVENAVVHGIAQRRGPGCVTVRATRHDDSLLLEVSDTGPGFRVSERNRGDRGLGLATTRARLEQLYGSRQRVECVDLPEGGASVRIFLPLQDALYPGMQRPVPALSSSVPQPLN